MTDDTDSFGHDPTVSENIEPTAPGSFDEAAGAVEDGDADGVGFVMTRHDPFLVLEIAHAIHDGEVSHSVERILSALGMSFAEVDGETVRVVYEGSLPGELHGGDPVTFAVGGDSRNYIFRFYDSGWTPMTGNHVDGTPTDCNEIDAESLRRLLSKVGVLDE